jgi:hypothetical protein
VEREGSAAHHTWCLLRWIRPQVVQRSPDIEVGRNAQEPLAKMDEDCNQRDGVGLEVDCLQPVVLEKPIEECPHGKAESLLVEGLEDDRLSPVLQGKLLAVVALPPEDRLLLEEATRLHVLQPLVGKRAGLPRLAGRWRHVPLGGGRPRGGRRGVDGHLEIGLGWRIGEGGGCGHAGERARAFEERR